MSDTENSESTTPVENENAVDTQEEIQGQPTELEVLKARAKLMGISHSGNIGVEALRLKIEEKLNETPVVNTNLEDLAQQEVVKEQVALNPLAGDTNALEQKPAAVMTFREQCIADAMRLIRVRITCMNPNKANLHGEVLCVGNDIIGTVKKFIPYGEFTDEGYHIPHVLYQELEARKFQNIRTTKDRRTGREKVETSWAKEFAIEVLPPLTQMELEQLATAQMAAGSLNE